MAEAKDIRLSESLEASQELKESWEKILSSVLPADLKDRKFAIIEDKDLSLGQPGTFGERVKDPQAEDGSALKLFNTHYEWCVNLNMSRIAYDAGSKYKLSVRIRVDKKPGAKGNAFWAGVYDPDKRSGCGGIQPKVEEVKDGYIWYDVLTWVPENTQYFWAGPGIFGRKQGETSTHNGVYLDAVRIERCD